MILVNLSIHVHIGYSFSFEICEFLVIFIYFKWLANNFDINGWTRQNSLLQGYLDRDQFTQLEELQDDTNPNFAEEIVSLFYNDSARLIRSIEQTMWV